MRVPRYALFGALALGLGACTDPLAVNNSNNPDRKRVFGAASDLESFVGSTYAIAHAGTLGAASVLSGGSNDGLQPQLLTMGMESVSGLANFAMGPRSSICTSGGCSGRTAIDNGINSQGNIGNLRDFIIEHRAARLATLGLARLQVLGSLGSATRDGRARAFGKFVEGVALGNLALAYDSAAIVTESNTDSADVPLSSYTDVMAAALGDLDSAITIAGTVSTSSDGFPLPANWINEASATISKTLFLQFVHSYKARFLAGVARTKAERDAVNWGRVITEVNAGITSDFNVLMSPTNGWDVAWPLQHYATGSASWHQMSQFFLGMADVSGGYDAFLAKAPTTRTPFVVVTPDRRFPQGATRAAQQADTQPVNFGSTRYFRNRPTGEDAPGDPLQISMYDFRRSFEFQVTNTRNGAYPIMTAAEIRLLKAEALLRQGGAANIDTAAKLINISRAAKGGLGARHAGGGHERGGTWRQFVRASRAGLGGELQGDQVRQHVGRAQMGVPVGDGVHGVRHVVLRRPGVGGPARRHPHRVASPIPGATGTAGADLWAWRRRIEHGGGPRQLRIVLWRRVLECGCRRRLSRCSPPSPRDATCTRRSRR